MTTTPDTERRDRIAAAIRQEWRGEDYDDHSYQLADAVIAADQDHAAEVRAAALREAAYAAEKLRQFEPATGPRKAAQVSENVGVLRVVDHLRGMAAAARPDKTVYDRRTWEGWRRDAGCGCTAPNPAECTAHCEPRVTRQCACHYLTARPDNTGA